MPISIAILVSGRGSNMQAILEAKASGALNIEIPVVCSNNEHAAALEIARSHGVEAVAISHKGLTREQHESQLLTALARFDVDYVVLAGYMRILTSTFLSAFSHPDGYFKVVNIHPSLLPAFPGASGYEDAFAYGVRLSGVTVHLVDEQVDHGPILAQESFPRLDDDTLESFKARGLAVEHRIYPAVLGQLSVDGARILVRPEVKEKSQVAATAVTPR